MTVQVIGGAGADRDRVEQELLTRGVSLPLTSRAAWSRAHPVLRSRLFAARRGGDVLGAVAAEEARSRALPGHVLWRVRRFDPGMPADVREAILRAIAAAARADWRVLRLSVDVVSRDLAARADLADALTSLGFTRLRQPREYARTLVVELAPSEAELYSAMPRVKKNIKQIERHPFAVREVADASQAPRLEALLRETLARTGGDWQPIDFARIVELSRALPAASRLVGLYRTDAEGPEALVAYAWGCAHGDYANYDVGASSREGDLRRFSLAYPLLWDLIRWARAGGASWFDLGGVSEGSLGTGDPLGGISDFKRAFSKEVVDVAEEWELAAHPLRASLARELSRGATRLAGLRRRLLHARPAAEVPQPAAGSAAGEGTDAMPSPATSVAADERP